MSNIVVIGCGAIGLTSALAIQKLLGSKANVTIVAKDFSPNLTSDIAAGLWEPYLLGDNPTEKTLEWSTATYEYILDLWKNGHAKEAGISLQPIINLSVNKNYTLPQWISASVGYNELSRDHLAQLSKRYNKTFTGGFLFVSFCWEASTFLPLLQQEFLLNGGKIRKETIEHFNQLSDFDLIVNCSGLEARNLASDISLAPIRGQIMQVEAPWQFHTVLLDTPKSTYIIPNINCVILGGTKDEENYTINVDNEEKVRILEDCSKIVPAIRDAKILKDLVGLRPGRNKVRLEIELLSKDNGNVMKIVHNYGHGGGGITLCIGCANEAAKLVQEALQFPQKSKL